MEGGIGIVIDGQTRTVTHDLDEAKMMAREQIDMGKDCYLELYQPFLTIPMSTLRWDRDVEQWVSSSAPQA